MHKNNRSNDDEINEERKEINKEKLENKEEKKEEENKNDKKDEIIEVKEEKKDYIVVENTIYSEKGLNLNENIGDDELLIMHLLLYFYSFVLI